MYTVRVRRNPGRVDCAAATKPEIADATMDTGTKANDPDGIWPPGERAVARDGAPLLKRR
jgi:hypothetical protein